MFLNFNLLMITIIFFLLILIKMVIYSILKIFKNYYFLMIKNN